MKSIRLVFGKVDGSPMSLTMNYAKADLTEGAVRGAMQVIIDQDVMTPRVVSIIGAEVIDRTVTELI